MPTSCEYRGNPTVVEVELPDAAPDRKLLTPVLVLLILLIFSEEQGGVMAAEPERVA